LELFLSALVHGRNAQLTPFLAMAEPLCVQPVVMETTVAPTAFN
jgi:hypothetical protein